jgi:hypothetical protein
MSKLKPPLEGLISVWEAEGEKGERAKTEKMQLPKGQPPGRPVPQKPQAPLDCFSFFLSSGNLASR